MPNLEEVRSFWEANPFWSGESSFDVGTIDFYKAQFLVVVNLAIKDKRVSIVIGNHRLLPMLYIDDC